jgi:hypothetical protein
MLIRFVQLIILCMLLTSCGHRMGSSPHPYCPEKTPHATETRQVGSFSDIDIRGRFNVSLHSGYSKPKIILKGAKTDLLNVFVSNVDGKLTINAGNGYPKCGQITVIVQGYHFNRFEYHGTGVVKGTKLNLQHLDLVLDNQGSTILGGNVGLRYLKIQGAGTVDISGISGKQVRMDLGGQGKIKLKGMADIASLTMKDKAWLSYYWVKSESLTVNGFDESYIQLAGIVDKLHVKLCDKSRFNGRYLRANRAFVKTFNHSLAEIAVVDRQHTLASDSSDIHFFNLPDMRTDFLAFDGAVLDMRDLKLPFIQQYDRYNKYTQM